MVLCIITTLQNTATMTTTTAITLKHCKTENELNLLRWIKQLEGDYVAAAATDHNETAHVHMITNEYKFCQFSNHL